MPEENSDLAAHCGAPYSKAFVRRASVAGAARQPLELRGANALATQPFDNDDERDQQKHHPRADRPLTAVEMFHLLSGLHTYLTRQDEFSLAIIGLDASGKTTFLEQVKHLYLPNQPAVDPAKIGPTVGQGGAWSSAARSLLLCLRDLTLTRHRFAVGKIVLPSTILQFWDLGGQRDIRSIWHRYYDDCQAVIYVVDASDKDRLAEGWTVFGASGQPAEAHTRAQTLADAQADPPPLDEVLASPQTQDLPLLLLANKQDLPGSLSPADIRESYEVWYQAHRSSTAGDGGLQGRGGSLEVLGISALEGCGRAMCVCVGTERRTDLTMLLAGRACAKPSTGSLSGSEAASRAGSLLARNVPTLSFAT